MKQLLIIVYKLQVSGFSPQHVESYMTAFIESYSLRDDEELKDNYTIREIFLPIREGDGVSDIQVIYPQPKYVSPDVNGLVNEITQRIKEDPNNELKSQWERLIRELKLRNLYEQS